MPQFFPHVGVYWYLQLLQHDQHTQPNIAAREQSSINNGLGASSAFLDSMKKYCNIPTLNHFNGLEGNLNSLLLTSLKHVMIFLYY